MKAVKLPFVLLVGAIFMFASPSLFAKGGKQAKAKVAVETSQQSPIDLSTYSPYGMFLKNHNTRSIQDASTGDTIGVSDYDYPTNSITPRRVYKDATGLVHIVFMERNTSLSGTAAGRAGSYVLYQDGVATTPVPYIPRATSATGWPSMDLRDDFSAIIVGHHSSQAWLATEQGPAADAFNASVEVGAGNYPSVIRDVATDSKFYVTNNDSSGAGFHVSTDAGATWSATTVLVDPKRAGGQSSEQALLQAPNGELSVIMGLTGNGTLPPAGTGTEDSADAFVRFVSTDHGATWTHSVLVMNGQKVVFGTDTLYLLPNNFAQIQAAYDASNVLHLVFNGYAVKSVAGSPTSYGFPVIYWNSSDEKLVELSSPAVDESPAIITADTTTGATEYPGNGIGLCYPSIALSSDGKVVVAMWTQPKLSSGAVVVDTTGYYETEIVGTFSVNGGKKWAAPTTIVTSAKYSQMYPNLDPTVSVSTTSDTAKFIYYTDQIAGQGVVDGTPFSLNPWIYREWSFTPTGVNEKPNVAARYALDQNYPNPFNPTTRIAYSVPQNGYMTLKVFNVLGEEVSTLFSGMQKAGDHFATFDASRFASGVYFYRLQAGTFSMTKKMVLMK